MTDEQLGRLRGVCVLLMWSGMCIMLAAALTRVL